MDASSEDLKKAYSLLLWHGVIGLINTRGNAVYIYDNHYNFVCAKGGTAHVCVEGSELSWFKNREG